ncbi:MAG: hypothetical protein J1E65_04610 [Lachnospiraceae bacterium]|nr:hypothetical protein [Lachnospiraceae bacterium]
MEDLTVVSFVMESDMPAKNSRFGKWQFYVTEEEIFTESSVGSSSKQGRIRNFTVHFPGIYRRKKAWPEEALREYEEQLKIPPQQGTVCYLYEEAIQSLLRREQEPLPFPWLQSMLEYYEAAPDNLFVLEDREIATEELAWQYVRKARCISVVTEKPEEFSRLQENLLQEYGFLLRICENAGKLYVPSRGRTVFVAGSRLYGLKPSVLPADSLFFCTDKGEGKKLCRRADGVRYIDIHTFLRDCIRDRRPLS